MLSHVLDPDAVRRRAHLYARLLLFVGVPFIVYKFLCMVLRDAPSMLASDLAAIQAAGAQRLRWVLWSPGWTQQALDMGLHSQLLGLVRQGTSAAVLQEALSTLQQMLQHQVAREALLQADIVPVLSDAIAGGWLPPGVAAKAEVIAAGLQEDHGYLQHKRARLG